MWPAADGVSDEIHSDSTKLLPIFIVELYQKLYYLPNYSADCKQKTYDFD